MRIARWQHGKDVGEGFVVGDTVVPFPDGHLVADILAGGLDAARRDYERIDQHAAHPLASVHLLPPVRATTIRDFVAFEEHVEAMTMSADGVGNVPPEWYEAPTFYFTNPLSVLGPEAIVSPPVTNRLDFELEVAAVIGGPGGANLDAQGGAAAIFGYTIMNDWSARDLQGREMAVRLGPAKGKDFALSLGPWIVTADELEDRIDPDGFLAIRAEAWLNGELVGEDLVANMGWTFGELVSYASRNSRVVPGDVLGSGTVGNGGCLAELWARRPDSAPAPLTEGDEVRLVVESLGELRNTVSGPTAAPTIRAARPRPRYRRRPADDAH